MMAVTCEKSADKTTRARRQTFCWWAAGGAASGTESTAEDQGVAPAPAIAGTLRAYPNPFNPEVEIVFELANADEVSVSVYDIRGRLVRSLASARLAGGEHRWS
ncbi:MAG: T9SS type A sorting domain-containing protein [bacterium]|nr:T9SS type A sorting domain-containing protein [bacterium]